MLKQIIDFLNLRLSVLNYFEELFCLCELKSDGEVRQPMQRGSSGEWRKVNFDEWNGVSYWRLRDDISTDEVTSLVAGKKRLNRVFPLRLVVAVPRAKVTVDDSYSFQRLAVSIEKVLTVQLGDLQNQIGAGRVTLAVNTEKADAKEVWDSETDGTLQFEPKYELLYGALDVTVTVTADVACFVSECDNPDTDILHTFDFCKPATRERLTDEQVACLEAALCETPPTLCEQLAEVLPADVVTDVFDCLTPEAQAELLDSECVIPPCDPVTLTINGTSAGSEPSGGEFEINVTLDGSPSGSWDGVDTWEVTSAPCPAPSLSVASSNVTPTFGANVTLTATPTNITPSSYSWYANGNQIGTGNGLVWAVSILGAATITCVATDGTVTAQGSTTITSTYVRRTSIYTDGVNDFARGWWNIGSAGGRALSASFYLKYISGSAFFIQIGEPVDGQNYVFIVQPSSTGPAFNFRVGAGGGFYFASQAVTANVWYHIVMTYRVNGWSTANPMAIYVNGTSIYSNGSPSGMLQIVKPSIQLGVPAFGGAASVKFHGLSLFEDCISAAQAATLYNGGTVLSDPTLSGVNRSEWFGGLEVAQVPSTNTALPYTKVVGVNGGVINCNNSFASPYGLVTDIP